MVTNMKIIRRDFVEDDNCFFCKRTLKTKIAYIIELEDGKEIQCGPCCAKKHFDKIVVANTPDFTRAVVEYVSKKSKSKDGNSIDNNNSTKELEYLLLRCKYLDDFDNFNKLKIQPLVDVYNKNHFEINDRDKKNINIIMDKLKDTKLGYKNLMACYQAKKILNMWIKLKYDDIESLNVAKKFYNSLKEYCHLTDNQVIGLNRWIVNMENIPKINGKWFFRYNNVTTS